MGEVTARIGKRSKEGKRAARRAADRKLGAKLHSHTCDLFAGVLSQFREGLVATGAGERVRVLVVVSTDHQTAGMPESLAIFTSASGHSRCLLEKALDAVCSQREPQIVGVRH